HREVASFVPLARGEPGPLAIHAAAVNPAADRDHRVAVPVIRPAVAVLADRAPELRHRQHDRVFHAIAKVAGKGRQAAGEVVEPCRELALRRSLVDVRVPSAYIGEGHLEANVRLRQLRNLLEGLPEGSAWI